MAAGLLIEFCSKDVALQPVISGQNVLSGGACMGIPSRAGGNPPAREGIPMLG